MKRCQFDVISEAIGKLYPAEVLEIVNPPIKYTNVPQLVDIRYTKGLKCYYTRHWYVPTSPPIPVMKSVMYSSCHVAGIHKQMITIEGHKRRSWNGHWLCNACEELTKPTIKKVPVCNPFVHLFKITCADNIAKTITHKIDIGFRHQDYFTAIKNSKVATFHECTSPKKAQELACTHWQTCKMCTARVDSWARTKENMEQDFKHIKLCPPTIKPVKKAVTIGFDKPKVSRKPLPIKLAFAQMFQQVSLNSHKEKEGARI